MKSIDVVAALRKANPTVRGTDLQIFADALTTYLEASANVLECGAVCAHPRTGAPVENPYLKVRSIAAATLAKFRRIDGDKVLKVLNAQKNQVKKQKSDQRGVGNKN